MLLRHAHSRLYRPPPVGAAPRGEWEQAQQLRPRAVLQIQKTSPTRVSRPHRQAEPPHPGAIFQRSDDTGPRGNSDIRAPLYIDVIDDLAVRHVAANRLTQQFAYANIVISLHSRK